MTNSYFAQHYSSIRYPISHTVSEPGLRRAQQGAIHAINAYFTLNKEPGIVTLPTGSGKTAVLMLSAFTQQAKRVLVVTPNRLVRKQTADGFRELSVLKRAEVLPENIAYPKVLEVTQQIRDTETWSSLKSYDVVVSTPHCISPHYEKIVAPPDDLFDMVLIDEGHHAPAITWKRILESFPQAKRILFTATPFRRDKKEIQGHFIYDFPLGEAWKDGIYSEIRYVPVTGELNEEETADIRIAQTTESVYRQDQADGYAHSIMIRTNNKKRALELLKIYQENTGLKLAPIYSGIPDKEISTTISALRSHQIDGVICVDMMGEGFDFPNLKIAAIHVPHKSLQVTLQFIGRFARPGEKIGMAKFIAAPAFIEGESVKLYNETKAWQDIVINLSEWAIGREKQNRENLKTFEGPDIFDSALEDLSLYSLAPYQHAKIYSIPEDVEINLIQLLNFKGLEIAYRNYSHELSTVIYVVREIVEPKWSGSEHIQAISLDMALIYFDQDNRLLFINSTRKSESLYEHLASQLAAERQRPLPMHEINRILLDMKELKFHNVGMKAMTTPDPNLSYQISAGTSADKSIDQLDSEQFFQGHAAGTGKENNQKSTLGYSSNSKLWGITYQQIPELIEWYQALATKIRRKEQPITGTGLDNLSVGEEIFGIPDNVLCAHWDPSLYKKSGVQAFWTDENGDSVKTNLLQLEIQILHEESSQEQLCIQISADSNFRTQLLYSLKEERLFQARPGLYHPMTITKGTDKVDLLDYLISHPLMFRCIDTTVLQGRTLYRNSVQLDEGLPEDLFEILDWKAFGVNIQNEEGPEKGGLISIQSYLAKHLDSHQAIFHDHGSGEMADFITLQEIESNYVISLYHCKGSEKPTPGARVTDVYEVMSQAMKSVNWLQISRIYRQIYHRHKSTGKKFIKGSLDDFHQVALNTRKLGIIFKVIVVQPGISQAAIDQKINRVIAGVNYYIRKTTGEHILLMTSA